MVPEGMTEAQVLAAIEKTAAILSPSFVFGCYDLDDIKQEARQACLLALAKYDPSRPLENFLYTHVRNRLINLKRNKFRRTDAPCKQCHSGEPCEDGSFCKVYERWVVRNDTKANLMRPSELAGESLDEQEGPDEEVIRNETWRLIDERLPASMRTTYLKMRDGVSVPKSKRDEVLAEIRSILCLEQDH